MARGSGLNLFGGIVSQSSLFLITTVIAHRLGSADVGRYAECYALLTLLGLLSLAGFKAALTRFVAMHLADDDPRRLRGTVRLGMGSSAAGSLVVAGVLAAVAAPVAGVFHDPGLRPAVLLVALALPATTFEAAALSATQGWRSQRAYTLIGAIFDPGLRLLLTVVLLWRGVGLIGALWALVVAAWIGAALSAVALTRRMASVAPAKPSYEVGEVLRFSLVSWGSALATTGLVWADTLLLGYLSTSKVVGTYTVATRLVTLAVFVMVPINAAFQPHIAHLYHVRDMAGVSRVYSAANRWVLRLSLPAFVLLLVYPRDLLQFFGHGYEAAAVVTVTLAVGQMVNAAAGPCGLLLNMAGRVRLSLIDNVAVLVLNVVLNLIFIPRYGMLAAAVAWSLSLTLVNAAKLLQVRLYLGVRGTDTGSFQTLVAADGALAAALCLAPLLHGWLPALLIGGSVVTVVFIAVLAGLGLGTDDAAMLKGAVLRVRRGGALSHA